MIVAGSLATECALINHGKAETMAVGGGAIACQGDDTGECAGLGLHVALGMGIEHTLLEGAVLAGNRQ